MADPNSKNVTILIDEDDLKTLKDAGYKLCFAKMVNNTFNVVWQSYNEYLQHNGFHWTPHYQLFGTNSFEDDIQVTASTNTVNIGLGEGCTLDKEGTLGKPTTQEPSTAITLNNKYGLIHPGLNQLSIGVDGTQDATTIYVAPQVMVSGTDVLTPVDQVQVWFEQDIETSTIFSTARSNAVQIDLTNSNSETRFYQNGEWSIPSPKRGELGEPATILTIIVTTTTALTVALLAAKIAAKLTGVYHNIDVDISSGDKKLTIKYYEKPGLSFEERRFVRTLAASPTLRDQLMDVTIEALAALGSGFTSLSAT